MFCLHILTPPPNLTFFFFLMIRRPPRSTLDRSSAASDVYKRQKIYFRFSICIILRLAIQYAVILQTRIAIEIFKLTFLKPVSYTHLRAHETVLDLVCRLLLEKKNKQKQKKRKKKKKNTHRRIPQPWGKDGHGTRWRLATHAGRIWAATYTREVETL